MPHLLPALLALLAAQPADTGRPLRIVVGAADKPDVGGASDVRPSGPAGGWSLGSPVELPFAVVQGVEVEGLDATRGKPKLRVRFQGTGDIDPDRRYKVEVVGLTAAGQTVWHTWQLQGDARQNKPFFYGSFIHTPSTANYSRFDVPQGVLPRLRTIKVLLRPMDPAEYRHHPPGPCQIDLTMTKPDAAGRFVLSFTPPEGERPGARRVAVAVIATDADEKVVSREVRFAEPRPDGRFRVIFQLDAKLHDRATVAVDFFDPQPDQPDFAQKFFVDGKGTSYRGSWLGLKRRLVDVPLD